MGNILLWVTFWYLGEQKLNTKLGQGNKFPKLGKIPHYWKKTEQNKQEKTQHNSLPDKQTTPKIIMRNKYNNY